MGLNEKETNDDVKKMKRKRELKREGEKERGEEKQSLWETTERHVSMTYAGRRASVCAINTRDEV